MNKRVEIRKSARSRRRLFVVDIENAIGTGMIDEESCKSIRGRIERTYHPSNNDLTVLGVSHKNNFFPAHAWDGARIILREGHDGADLALENVLSNENVEERFGEVVIVSGDGLFSRQASRLKSLGVRVTVDARARQLARVLAFSCTSVRLAPDALIA